MPKELETLGFVELEQDMLDMARTLSSEYGTEWAAQAEDILQEAAQPVLDVALRLVPVRTGKLRDAVMIGKVVKRKGGDGYTITIGKHKDSEVNYARMVEFGHGGQKPAGAHKFMRPAYEEAGEQAYAIIRKRMQEKIDQIGS